MLIGYVSIWGRDDVQRMYGVRWQTKRTSNSDELVSTDKYDAEWSIHDAAQHATLLKSSGVRAANVICCEDGIEVPVIQFVHHTLNGNILYPVVLKDYAATYGLAR